jgi:hypothetical protein
MNKAMRLLGCLAAAGAAGCVSIQEVPMTAASADAIRGREMSVSQRGKPDFGAMTPGKMAGGALFGALGGAIAGAAMISAGNEIVAQNNVEDPAEYIADTLSGAMKSKFDTALARSRTALATDDADEAGKTNSRADLVLDVRTLNWGFIYFPTSWDRYRLHYIARARLIDARKGQILAEGRCTVRAPESADAAPTHDELLAGNAARLKKDLKAAADFCAAQFAAETFSLGLAALRPAPSATGNSGARRATLQFR